jgi:uncharacterized protein YyaL (SSP411 family)
MKKSLLMLLMAVMTLFADVDWVMDYQDAISESKESGKPIFVMISREKCHYCYFMKSQVFTDPKVSAFLNENFVPVELDLENDPLPDYLKPYGTPTFYIVADGGKRMSRPIVGAAKADAFVERIKKELEAFRKR